MRASIDTSSLFKKYVNEQGAEQLEKTLDSVSEIIIAPITILEVSSVVERRIREKTLQPSEARWILKEFQRDYQYFSIVQWNEALIEQSLRIIRTYTIRVLDSIQLASALISDSSLFITSDKNLYEIARQEVGKIVYI